MELDLGLAAVPGRATRNVAAERRVSPKAGTDWFITPRGATEAVLSREILPMDIVWDPCAGDGAMVDPVRDAGYRVLASDIDPQRFDVDMADFLAARALPVGVGSIIMNPPFNIAGEFVEQALLLDPRKLLVFCRLAFLEGQERGERLYGPRPPCRVWVHSSRQKVKAGRPKPGMPPAKGKGDGISTIALGWYVWERGHRGSQMGWLP